MGPLCETYIVLGLRLESNLSYLGLGLDQVYWHFSFIFVEMLDEMML